jgi:polyisoprenyl-phosphate glycosyltransferase
MQESMKPASPLTHASKALVSVIVPVYAGEAYLEELVARLSHVRTAWQVEGAPIDLVEVILVDDAAIDRSPQVIDALAAQYPWIVALHLSRNFGQHPATIAGILYSSGDWIVTMDEDLQHPPARINDLLAAAVKKQADVVYAKAKGDVHSSHWRDLGSRGYKQLMSWVANDPNLPNYSSFRLLRGPIGRAAASVCGHDTYFDVNVSWYTQRSETVPMQLEDLRFQRTGKSGYSLSSLVSHALRMLFSSHLKILRGGALLGLLMLIFSALGSLYLIGVKLVNPASITVEGWTSLMIVVVFLGGCTIFMIGIALQYLSTLVLQAHGKPKFFVVDRSSDAELAAYFERKGSHEMV